RRAIRNLLNATIRMRMAATGVRKNGSATCCRPTGCSSRPASASGSAASGRSGALPGSPGLVDTPPNKFGLACGTSGSAGGDVMNKVHRDLVTMPDTTASVREKFGFDSDMVVPAYSVADSHVPDV